MTLPSLLPSSFRKLTSIYDITEHTTAPKTGNAWNIVCINLLSAEALQFIMKQWSSVPRDISKSKLMSFRLPPQEDYEAGVSRVSPS